MKSKYLDNSEVVILLEKIKSGDNAAWEELYGSFEDFIHNEAWSQLKALDLSDDKKQSLEPDLFQAGWLGFISAVKNYDPGKGALITLAKSYVYHSIQKEKWLWLNSLGITDRPAQSEKLVSVSVDEIAEALKVDSPISVEPAPEGERFNARRQVLQILNILRLFTDEDHSLTQRDLFKKLKDYRSIKHGNSAMEKSPETLYSAILDLLSEVSEVSYNEKKKNEVSNLYYVHPFKNQELDEIISLIAFTDMLSGEEKENLIEKLVGTASLHYRSPFWDGEKLRFDPKAVYGRFSSKALKERRQLAENIKILQFAVNNLIQIKFKFNKYNSSGVLAPVSENKHSLSPYHLVVYHDNFYCIGLKNDDSRVWHYRVDLMSDVEIIKDDNGRPLPIVVSDFKGLPIGNSTWNPEKYMAEHLNMAYDTPRDIRIKIKNTAYTIVHDWFGNHYERLNEQCEEGYDVLKVKTSPSMIVHWALQYGTAVEILDEDIRSNIREELSKLGQMYGG